MSCNGCRVLRKGCSEACILRPCLQWIESPESQGHATLFVAKFFGRAGLLNFISSVPPSQRPALFQSLLFEACGRTVNPVNGAVGLLGTGNWQLCQVAVETVLRGGKLEPLTDLSQASPDSVVEAFPVKRKRSVLRKEEDESEGIDLSLGMMSSRGGSPSVDQSEVSGTTSDGCGVVMRGRRRQGREEVKLLELFN